MNNKTMKTYKNKHERKMYNETTFRSSDGKFGVVAAVAQLCDCCTRYELYIAAFHVGVRKDYNVDTLLAIFHNSLSVRQYAKYLIDDIEANLAHAIKWETPAVDWYRNNISDIKYFFDNFEKYARDEAEVPHFYLNF